jgi:hypothetical protein
MAHDVIDLYHYRLTLAHCAAQLVAKNLFG